MTRLLVLITALCGFFALSATPSAHVKPALCASCAVEAPVEPAAGVESWVKKSPVPRAKPAPSPPAPEAEVAVSTVKLPDGSRVVQHCDGSTMVARDVPGSDGSVYEALFHAGKYFQLLGEGCVAIQQGCNTCSVSYVNCKAPEAAASCTDGDCLAQHCERKVVCSSKRCTAYADKAPPCEARFAKHSCLKSAFE